LSSQHFYDIALAAAADGTRCGSFRNENVIDERRLPD
jgi:hypothetical protein